MKKKNIIIIIALLVLIIVGVTVTCLVLNKKGTPNEKTVEKEDNEIVTTITIDVNPSIEINLNKDNKVVSVVGLNEDSEKILEGKNFKGNDLEKAIDTVVESLVENGYLKENANTILINVESTEKINVEETVNKIIKENKIECEVIVQEIEITEEIKKQAEEYNMTPSKYYYIKEQIKEEKDLKIEDFKDTSVDQVKEQIETHKEEVKKQEEEKKKTETKKSSSSSGERKGSLSQCEKVPELFSNTAARDASIAAAGADSNASWEAQTTLDFYNNECAWETIFYYNQKKYYYYHSITDGRQLGTKSETYLAAHYDDVVKIAKKYMSEHYGVTEDEVFVNGSGSSGYDDPNNEVIVKINGKGYTLLINKKTGNVNSCREGSLY